MRPKMTFKEMYEQSKRLVRISSISRLSTNPPPKVLERITRSEKEGRRGEEEERSCYKQTENENISKGTSLHQ